MNTTQLPHRSDATPGVDLAVAGFACRAGRNAVEAPGCMIGGSNLSAATSFGPQDCAVTGSSLLRLTKISPRSTGH
jgi:hypothetical protein